MFNDVLFVVNNDELHIHDYFTREFLERVKLGEKFKSNVMMRWFFFQGN